MLGPANALAFGRGGCPGILLVRFVPCPHPARALWHSLRLARLTSEGMLFCIFPSSTVAGKCIPLPLTYTDPDGQSQAPLRCHEIGLLHPLQCCLQSPSRYIGPRSVSGSCFIVLLTRCIFGGNHSPAASPVRLLGSLFSTYLAYAMPSSLTQHPLVSPSHRNLLCAEHHRPTGCRLQTLPPGASRRSCTIAGKWRLTLKVPIPIMNLPLPKPPSAPTVVPSPSKPFDLRRANR